MTKLKAGWKKKVQVTTNKSFISRSEEETLSIGKWLASQLKKGDLVTLQGDLGTGKTTLVKGIATGFFGEAPRAISSPTFTYLHIYGPLYHFDLYRLKDPAQFLKMGFSDYLQQDGICLIEWPDRIDSLLPLEHIRISLKHLSEKEREIHVSF